MISSRPYLTELESKTRHLLHKYSLKKFVVGEEILLFRCFPLRNHKILYVVKVKEKRAEGMYIGTVLKTFTTYPSYTLKVGDLIVMTEIQFYYRKGALPYFISGLFV